MSPGTSNPVTVAMVTPSFNQARFLRECIDSVLAQTYPAIDYLVVDGGSTDGSVEILRSYGDRIRWLSEPDQGQSDAIAKGFSLTQGDVLAWINSDDRLLPHAAERVVTAFERAPAASLVYANGWLLDETGATTGVFPWIEPFDLWRLAYFSDYILQPSAFFRRSAYDAVGGLDRSLHYAMDWDLWIRLAGAGDVVYLENELLGCSRIWGATKTSTGGWRRIAELSRIARRHAGERLTPAVQRYALDTLGCRLRETLPPALLRLAAAIGARLDARILRRMPAHADGWIGRRVTLLAPRRWRRVELELEVIRLPRLSPLKVAIRIDGARRRIELIDCCGSHRIELELPDGNPASLVRIEIRTHFSFRYAHDPRRLSMRLSSCRPATAL